LQIKRGKYSSNMSVHEIIAQLPKLSEEERELILRRLVSLEEPFESTPAALAVFAANHGIHRQG
jgi:hypothetical protein